MAPIGTHRGAASLNHDAPNPVNGTSPPAAEGSLPPTRALRWCTFRLPSPCSALGLTCSVPVARGDALAVGEAAPMSWHLPSRSLHSQSGAGDNGAGPSSHSSCLPGASVGSVGRLPIPTAPDRGGEGTPSPSSCRVSGWGDSSGVWWGRRGCPTGTLSTD